MPEVDLETLLTRTDAFINTMYAVRDHFSLPPEKQHIATCINYSDLMEMRQEFVRELKNTVLAFVYSRAKQSRILENLQEQGRDEAGAWSALLDRARAKFRTSSLRGQFSELLLCNLLQHYFKAVPLLRKMPITTNPEVERHGADAIHIASIEERYQLYIGEAKTYDRKTRSLKAALVDAIKDVVQKHYPNHRTELDLYTFEDFLTPDLEGVAQSYLDGTLTDIEVQLVCIVTYDCKHEIEGGCRDEILNCAISHVRREALAARKHPLFRRIPAHLLPRMNYILFPVKEMDELIGLFKATLGS